MHLQCEWIQCNVVFAIHLEQEHDANKTDDVFCTSVDCSFHMRLKDSTKDKRSGLKLPDDAIGSK